VQQEPEAAAEAHEEAVATQIQISAERAAGAVKRITAELPGAAAKLVAAVA
jgi:hypothetical protein